MQDCASHLPGGQPDRQPLLLQGMMMRSETQLADPWAKLMVLGLGLLFLGKQDAVEATVEVQSHLL